MDYLMADHSDGKKVKVDCQFHVPSSRAHTPDVLDCGMGAEGAERRIRT